MKFNESVITDEPVKGLSTFIIPTKVKELLPFQEVCWVEFYFLEMKIIKSLHSPPQC